MVLRGQPGIAYFGVALRPGYVRRVREAQRDDDGSDGFTWAFTRHERENPPLDPAADIVLDLGRDIPSSVRAILGKIRDGDSLDTLIRMADEHRLRCEWAVRPGDEGDHQELTVRKRDEVHLIWTKGRLGDKTLAVLHRLDHDFWELSFDTDQPDRG